MKKIFYSNWRWSILIIAVLIVALAMKSGTSPHKPSSKIQVVAAENFWGSLVSQIGGSKVQVKSIVNDPNADPHEYESNNSDARAFANANYVVVNGVGYDNWANKLLSGNPNPDRKVLTIASLFNKKVGDNPHLWYNPEYVNGAVAQMEHDLIAIDPADKGYFVQKYDALESSLSAYQNRIKSIKTQYGGQKVAATEDIFEYLATASGLDLVSPPAFTQAVAEGNDPPTSSIVEFQQQLQSRQIKLLVYNEQTVTPLTDNIKKLAAQANIPIVGVTETIQPPDTSFQDWMNAQLIEIENGLNSKQLGN